MYCYLADIRKGRWQSKEHPYTEEWLIEKAFIGPELKDKRGILQCKY